MLYMFLLLHHLVKSDAGIAHVCDLPLSNHSLRDGTECLHTVMQTEREGELHALARTLLEHETLTRDEIQQVLDGTFSKTPIAKEAAEAEVADLIPDHVAREAVQSRSQH